MNIAIILGRANSKGLKNKNVRKIFSKPMFIYPIEAAKKVKLIQKIYVSSDSGIILNTAKQLNCEVIKRPKYLCNDKALLEDAINYSVKHCLSKNQKVNNFVILLCNSVCVNYKEITNGINFLNKNKTFDTVTTVSKFNMFSPVRAKKLVKNKLKNYIPLNVLNKVTSISCDRDKSIDTFFCNHSFTISRSNILQNMKKNPMPFKWMGKQVKYVMQDFCVGDIDFEWQIPVVSWWLKKYLKKQLRI